MKQMLLVMVCILLAAGWAYGDEASPGANSEIEELRQRIYDLEQKIEELQAQQAPSDETESTSEVGGRFQQLPDISFILQAKAKFTDDKADPDRQKLQLTEAELALQSYVYPEVRLDAFIAGCPAEHEHSHFHIHEAYVTYIGLKQNLNVMIGQKFVPFGRVNQLHNHSWLYARQPLVLSNLVAPESLAGQGILLDYNLPVSENLFARVDVGFWANGSESEQSDLPNIMVGPGADLTDRFRTIRLWLGKSVAETAELEAGWSWAGGRSEEDAATLARNYVHLRGVDISYRRFGRGARRLLLRGEYVWRKGTLDSGGASAVGYYLFANYRWDRYNSIGLLYDWSKFPQDTFKHESAVSFILTHQFSEQYYVRLQATMGSRPNAGSYNELWLHWAWGIGPHTHNLE
ncbi:MAG: hypothetical protein QHI38_09220 [Armatimonadota bacterium]|nr:hypothetical protein [Armatimonadota bacterium]